MVPVPDISPMEKCGAAVVTARCGSGTLLAREVMSCQGPWHRWPLAAQIPRSPDDISRMSRPTQVFPGWESAWKSARPGTHEDTGLAGFTEHTGLTGRTGRSLSAPGSLSASALGASRHPSAKPAKKGGRQCRPPWTRRTHADPTGSLLELIPDQRFEYCGALRAFLRPAFLRSLTRASRVSMPAFFSAGRDASASMALRARATPKRRAPA